MQEFLTGLFDLIFVSFTVIMVFDFTVGLNYLLPKVNSENEQAATPKTDRMSQGDNVCGIASAPTTQGKEAIAPTISPNPPALLPDPWTLPIDEQIKPLSKSQQSVKFKPLLLLPPARPRLDLAALKKYLLHGKTVVRVEDITTVLPNGLKQYKLRGKPVLSLADLEAVSA